jgi:RHS repeat-associated protein
MIQKKWLILLMICTVFSKAGAQQSAPPAYAVGIPVSYVRTWEASAPEQDGNALMNRPVQDVLQATQYLDGLGRPLQAVIKQGSQVTGNTAVDKVSALTYDELGRQQYRYLPFTANTTGGNTSVNDGAFKTNPFQQQQSFMQQQYGAQGETFFYSKIDYEASPLNRVQKAKPQGNSWVGSNRGTEIKYWTNTAVDIVRRWDVTNVQGGFAIYSTPAAYTAGVLDKTVTIDETGKQVIVFKDRYGNTLLKKVQLSATADDGTGSGYNGWISTYYIYDDLGNLRCTVLPEAVKALQANGWQLTQSMLDEQCFRYEYDKRSRLVRSKAPGAGEVWSVYDSRNRPVLTQDANLRAKQQWLYTQYDELDRLVATGLWNNAQDINYHAVQAYNSTAYPDLRNQSYEELTRTYYDDYNWLAANGNPFSNTRSTTDDVLLSTATTAWPYWQSVQQSNATRSLATGTKVKVPGTATYLYSIAYYDDKGRLIQEQSQNISSGTDISTTQYSWAGQPLLIIERVQKGGADPQTTILVTRFSYDALGRLIKTEKKISNSLVNNSTMPASFTTTAELAYDALGQLKTKKIGSKVPATSAPIETLNYDYNIRGWLLGMNRDFAKDANSTNYFGFDLGYDKANNNIIGNQTYANPQYNGNIAGMVWKSKGDGEKRKYDFGYDNASRLLVADFNQYTGGSFNKTANVDFSIKMGDGINAAGAYDDNGNIKNMSQKGLLLTTSNFIDQLTYTYQPNSNKLQQVTDNSNDNSSKLGDFKYDPAQKTLTDYTYDANGNLAKDNNKRITSIRYNYLNLPEHIEVAATNNPVPDGYSIDYTYDALGNKLMKKVTTPMQGVVSANRVNTTTYIGDLVYERNETIMTITSGGISQDAFTTLQLTVPEPAPSGVDVLQFINMEEGRIRFKPAVDNKPAAFAFDYFIKDHLGNVRMVLTDEQQIDKYPVASLEPAKMVMEKNYYDIQEANVVDKSTATGISNYINDNGIGNNPEDAVFSAANSTKLYRLNSNTAKTGLGITLKVIAGDKIDVLGKSYYFQNSSGSGNNSNIPITDILNAFLNAPATATTTAVHGTVTAAAINTPAGIAGITNMMNQQGTQSNAAPSKPRAFINVIFFDEQFKAVDYKISMVGNNSTVKDHYADLQNIAVPKNGFVYIYCSNESPVNVYFDNLQVVHTRGSILEESHYYPYGLKMDGISTKAFGNMKNPYQYQGDYNEYDNETGWNDFELRNYDAQIGRFIQQDPYDQFASPYTGMGNDPINNVDPSGGWLEGMDGIGKFAVEHFVPGLAGAAIGAISTKGNASDKLRGAMYGFGAGMGASYLATEVNWGAVGNGLSNAGQWIGNQIGSFNLGGATNIITSVLEVGNLYKSADAAAIAFSRTYYNKTMQTGNNSEYSGMIYEVKAEDGKIYYSYTPGVSFNDEYYENESHNSGVSSPSANDAIFSYYIPQGCKPVGHIHSHLPVTDPFGGQNENYSDADQNRIKENPTLNHYLITPNGKLKVYHRDENNAVVIAYGMDKTAIPNLSAIQGPNNSTDDLKPVKIKPVIPKPPYVPNRYRSKWNP